MPNNSHQGAVIGDGKHPGKCEKCGTEFEGLRPGMTLCSSCWYAGEMNEADASFAPLIAVAQAAGLRTEVLQTGGMVMCLAAYPTEAEVPYIMWGDPDYHDDSSFCVYIQNDDSEEDLVVLVPDDATLPPVLAQMPIWLAMAWDPVIAEVDGATANVTRRHEFTLATDDMLPADEEND